MFFFLIETQFLDIYIQFKQTFKSQRKGMSRHVTQAQSRACISHDDQDGFTIQCANCCCPC